MEIAGYKDERMSHLPIKPVDHYLDKLQNKHVLFVGGAVVILLVLCGPWLSDLLLNTTPPGASAPGQYSQHYTDGVLRTATTPPTANIDPRLYATAPFVTPPYQTSSHDLWLQGYQS